MKKPGQPLFLARRNYRRRRLVDAARLLPVLGLFLVLLPILWHPQTTPQADTVAGGEYLFAVWFLLIVAAFAVSRLLNARQPPEGDNEDAR
ncbi:MAG: hypothetical protein R3E44_16550 [Paracoccaceae bacterium]